MSRPSKCVSCCFQEKIRLKFKLSYSIDTSSISDVGDVDDFPVP